MRTIRALTTALALTAVLPGIGAAQAGRPFKDSWFWGIKGGGLTYSAPAPKSGSSFAPVVGADWLITRSQGGLYVSFSQAFLTQSSQVDTLDAADASAPHNVSLKGLRRVELAAMAFPQISTIWHPYGGIGLVINQIGTASASYSGLSQNEAAILDRTITDARTALSPLLIAGTQYRLPWFSAFAQATFSPTQKNFFLYNGSAANFGYEFGIRYNIGSSISQE